MAPTLNIFGVASRFLYSGGWQVCVSDSPINQLMPYDVMPCHAILKTIWYELQSKFIFMKGEHKRIKQLLSACDPISCKLFHLKNN